jgi:hypothetical protein
MTRDQFFKLVPARQFFTKYCPGITNYYHKCRGYDGNKKPIDFTDDDKAKMRKAAAKMGDALQDVKF